MEAVRISDLHLILRRIFFLFLTLQNSKHGVYRPALEGLVKTNKAPQVRKTSAAAVAALPSADSSSAPAEAPATAAGADAAGSSLFFDDSSSASSFPKESLDILSAPRAGPRRHPSSSLRRPPDRRTRSPSTATRCTSGSVRASTRSRPPRARRNSKNTSGQTANLP